MAYNLMSTLYTITTYIIMINLSTFFMWTIFLIKFKTIMHFKLFS